MLERSSIQYGMPVRGAHGEFFGRVLGCGQDHFLIRRSVWTRRRGAVAYDDVAALRKGMVWLKKGREALLPEEATDPERPLMSVAPLDPTAERVGEAVPRGG